MDDDEALSPSEEVKFEVVERKKKGKKNSKKSRLQTFSIAQPLQPRKQRNSQSGNDISNDISESNEINDMIQSDAALSTGPKYEAEQTEKEHKLPAETEVISPPTPKRVPEILPTRALSKFAKTYELEKFKKNALLILNHINIDGYDTPRLGTDEDVKALTETFEMHQFEVEVENELTKNDIREKLKEFTSRDFTDYGCVGVVVLTHGASDGRIHAKDLPYSELLIINHLQAGDKPSLVSKPRFLIIQACRGTKSIKGVAVGLEFKTQIDSYDDVKEHYTLPVEADIIVLHSSYIGKVSLRHILKGSWFIQALCKKIKELSDTVDLESILTEVKRDVAIDNEHEVPNRITGEIDVNKQMPVVTSTLIRKLYLKKKAGSESYTDSNAALPASSNNFETAVDGAGSCTPPPTPEAEFCKYPLNYFEYIKNCMSHLMAEYPDSADSIGAHLLNISSTLKDEDTFNESKEGMAKFISEHIKTNKKYHPSHKYIYFIN